MAASIIRKLCWVGVLSTASVLPSLAAEPEGVAVHRPAPDPTTAQIEALENYSAVSLKRVHFSADQFDLTRSEKARLGQVAKTLSEHPATIIELRGYADGATSRDANIALSLERANAVARFLLERHVAQERILILGLGEVDPAGLSRRADNQRVDVRVFAPPTAETRVRHESVEESFIKYTWGGRIEP